MIITKQDLQEWRTGLHAANPQQAQELVSQRDAMLEALEAASDFLDHCTEFGAVGVTYKVDAAIKLAKEGT